MLLAFLSLMLSAVAAPEDDPRCVGRAEIPIFEGPFRLRSGTHVHEYVGRLHSVCFRRASDGAPLFKASKRSDRKHWVVAMRDTPQGMIKLRFEPDPVSCAQVCLDDGPWSLGVTTGSNSVDCTHILDFHIDNSSRLKPLFIHLPALGPRCRHEGEPHQTLPGTRL